MEMEGPWELAVSTPTNAYLYNGKELQSDFGLDWLDFGFRYYDPSIGRFPCVDPIIEKFPHLTAYNYASNDPIGKIDLWGLQGTSFEIRFNNRVKRYLNEEITQQQFIDQGAAEAKGAIAAVALISPVDEVFLAGKALSKVPGAGQALGAIAKIADKALDSVKGWFKSGDKVSDLASGVSKNIHEGKQGKHIKGHNNFEEGRSELTGDAQNLLDDLQGGNVRSAEKINDDKTRVDFGKEIGNYVNPDTKEKIPTTVGTVINSKTGAHIVPARPKIETNDF